MKPKISLLFILISLSLFNMSDIYYNSSLLEFIILLFSSILITLGIFTFSDIKKINKVLYIIFLTCYIWLSTVIVLRNDMYLKSNMECTIIITDKIYIVDIKGEDLRYLNIKDLEFDAGNYISKPILYNAYIVDIFGFSVNKGYRLKSGVMVEYTTPKLIGK